SLADATPGWASTASSTACPSSPSASRPRTSIQARCSPRQQCRRSVAGERTGSDASSMPVLAMAFVACSPAKKARDGNDRRKDVEILKSRLMIPGQLVLRNGVLPARRPAAFLAGLLAAFCAGAFVSGSDSGLVGTVVSFALGAGADPFCRRVIRCNTSAPPPTASNTGHSTRPATPSAPRANAAAGGE